MDLQQHLIKMVIREALQAIAVGNQFRAINHPLVVLDILQLKDVMQEKLLKIAENWMEMVHYLKVIKKIGVELCIHQLDKKHVFINIQEL
jgi:hypothetical protein